MKTLTFSMDTWEYIYSHIPFGAENIYSVSVRPYGYYVDGDDFGFEVVLTPSNNPTGWDTIEQEIEEQWRLYSSALLALCDASDPMTDIDKYEDWVEQETYDSYHM